MIYIISHINDAAEVSKVLAERNKNYRYILNTYLGFEGNYIHHLNNDDVDLRRVLSGYHGNRNLKILQIEELSVNKPKFLPNFHFIGYEFGSLCEDYDSYSSIFNEILFGKIKSLTKFSLKLNKYGIFDSCHDVLEYKRAHVLATQAGLDVEHEDILNIYQIGIYSSRTAD